MNIREKIFWVIQLYFITYLFTSCGSGSQFGSDVNISVKNKNSITNLSYSLSTVTVAQSEIAVDNSLKVTVTLLNNSGTAFPSKTVSVDLTLSGGTSEGTLSSVSRTDDGIYEATFTGTKVGTALTVSATINDKIITSTLPTITVVPGNSSLAQSLLTLSSSAVASGSTVTLTLQVKDGSGNKLIKGGSTIVFSHSGGTSTGTFSAVTDNNDGTYTGTFTGVTSGSATTLSASINGLTLTSSLPTITVSPGSYSLSQSLVTITSSTVNSGSSTTVTLTVKDGNLNLLTSGGLSVSFSLTGGTSTGTFSAVTDNANGTYTASLTGVSAGTAASVTATIEGISIQSTLPTVTVSGGTASSIAISGGGNNQSAAVGTLLGTVLSVIVKDASNNALSGINIDWSVTAGGGSLSLCSATTNASGISTCSYTLGTTPGANTITATVNGTAITTSFSETATVGAVSKLLFVQQPSNAASGAAIAPSITVRATDSYGNTVTAYATNIDIAIDTNPSTGTLSGTTSQAPASGVSTFNDLSLNYYGTGYKLIASSGALTTATSSAFNITATAVSYDWPYDVGSEANYTIGSGIDFSGGVARLTANDQTDDENTSSYGFLVGTPYGVSYGTLSDGTTGVLKLANANGCDGTANNCAELDSSWAPQWSSLVSYWKLNNNTNDSVGSNNGTANGGVTYSTSSKVGTHTGYFDGVDDNISIPDSNSLDFSTAITISVWFKMNRTGSWERLVSKDNNSGQHHVWLFQVDSTNGSMTFNIGSAASNTEYIIYLSSSPHDQRWHHYVGTYSAATGLAKIYIDGILYRSSHPGDGGDNTGNLWSTNLEASTGVVTIGKMRDNNNSYYTKGYIDDVALWSVELTEPQIKTIFNRQYAKYSGSFTSRVMDAYSAGQSWTSFNWIPTLPFYKMIPDSAQNETTANYSSLYSSTLMTNILGLWHFSESAATAGGNNDFSDSSGNGNHGEASGSLTFGAPGIFGNGITTTTTSDRVTLKNTIQFDSGNFTISIWFKTDITHTGYLWESGNSGTGRDVQIFNHGSGGIFIYCSDATKAINIYDSTSRSDGRWHHVALQRLGNVFTVYIDGVSSGTQTNNLSDVDTAGVLPSIGNRLSGQGTEYNQGSIDEVAVWGRALDVSEILQLYRRGANRLKYQVRSCSDSSCSTGSPSWLGPDGTNQTYFSELYNSASNSLTGAVSNGLPTMTVSNFVSLSVAANRYFQYRTIFESDDINTRCNYGGGANTAMCSPELKSVAVSPLHYSSSSPAIYGASGLSYYTLVSLAETPGAGGCTSGITYNVSTDKVNWKYWDGAAWSLSGGTAANSNTAAVISTNASSFPHAGVAYIKALLNSSGTSTCEIDGLHLSGQK